MAGKRRRIRYAVVGLGGIAQEAVLPAFAHTKNAELAALVSGDPAKQKSLGRHYQIENTYSYEQYEECLASGGVDAVYIALPNHLHAPFTIASARAGIHVLCEKPMAPSAVDCQAMMRAARDGDVKLMIAYRLHFEAGNLGAIRIAQSGGLGELRIFNSVFTQQVHEGNVRLHPSQGGGTLEDMGIYCINAARYLFQDEPVEVYASGFRNGDPRFQQIDEMTAVVLRFPHERLATFTCSFGADPVSHYTLLGTNGSLRVEPSYEYNSAIRHYLTLKGKTTNRTFPRRDQFAAELDYFSGCILRNQEPEPSGEEGLADVRIIEALRQSVQRREAVTMNPLQRTQRPGPELGVVRPPVMKPPRLIHAMTASGGT